MQCIECGLKMKTRREDRYHDAAKGFRVLLKKIEVSTDANDHVAVGIEKSTGLYREIARALVEKSTPLAAAEFRFLRSHLGWEAQHFAEIIGVPIGSVSRWENGKRPIGSYIDRFLRVLVVMREPIDGFDVEQLRAIADDVGVPLELELELLRGKWQASERRRARAKRSA